jgi:hypothetical protein
LPAKTVVLVLRENILRFLSLHKLVCACCFIAAMPGYVLAQGIAEAEVDARQPAQSEFAWSASPAQPESENVLMPSVSSPTNSPAQPSDSSSANQTLPDAPSSLINHGYVPLPADERWQNFWNSTLLSPLSYIGVLGGAIGQELARQPQQWGTRLSGYAKRVGVNLVQFGAQETIHQGGAALMHTDPRYLPCRCSGIHRSWHALEMSLLTYRDDGSKTLDVPQLAGAYGGAIIAEIPYPSHYSPLVQGVQNGHIQVGAIVAINLFREFSPELRRLNPFRRRAAQQ